MFTPYNPQADPDDTASQRIPPVLALAFILALLGVLACAARALADLAGKVVS